MIGYFPSQRRRQPRGPLQFVVVIVAIVSAATSIVRSILEKSGSHAATNNGVTTGTQAAARSGDLIATVLLATFAVLVIILIFFLNRAAIAAHADRVSESSKMETNKPVEHGALWIAIVVLSALLIGAVLLFALPRSAEAQGTPYRERGAFVMMTGPDTTAIERFSIIGDSVQSDLNTKTSGRILWSAHTLPNFSIAKVALFAWVANAVADSPPMQTAVIDFRNDSALVEVSAGGRSTNQRFKVTPGAIASMPSSFVALELICMRAQAAGGTLDVPIWTTSGAVSLAVKVVPAGAGKLSVTIGGGTYLLDIDAKGHILSGTLASNITIKRVDATTADKIALGKPDYSAPAGAPYSAEEVSFTTPQGIRLGGTLTKPNGASGALPAVVTITGSGQQDRDEYIPVAGGYRPFRQMADTLGRRGIAVLRLDDRTIGASGGALGTSADYADDIRAALAFLRARPDIDGKRLAVLGHSEGGLIGPMVAASDPQLAGLVVLAGPSDNGMDILRFQNRFAIDHDSTIVPSRRDSLYKKAYAAIDTVAMNDKWFGFFVKYDPIATAKKVKTPTIILQGATDQQVTPEQATKLAAAIRANGNKDVTLRVFPELNHLFIHDPSGNPAGYMNLATNKVSPDVLGALADWLVVKLGATVIP